MGNQFLQTRWSTYLGELRPIWDIKVKSSEPGCYFSGSAVYQAVAPTPTATETPTMTPTNTVTPTNTQTQTPSQTQTQTPSNTATQTPSQTQTRTPAVTSTPTQTQTQTQTQTPSITPTSNTVCPEQINVTLVSGSANMLYGNYNRVRAYSGGTFQYAYFSGQTTPILYVGSAPGGINYPVYEIQSGSTYSTFIRNLSGTTGLNSWFVYTTTGTSILENYNVTKQGIHQIDTGSTISFGVSYPRQGQTPLTINNNIFYLSYPSICPTSTPTPSITPTKTPVIGASRYLIGVDNAIYYSDNNGLSYSITNSNFTGITQVQEIAYGNNVWVATADKPAIDRAQIWYSLNNGIDWSIGFDSLTSGRDAKDVYFFGDFWLAGIGNSAYTSTNGITWTYKSTSNFTFRTFGYNGSRIVAGGNSDLRYSNNSGSTWSAATTTNFTPGTIRDVWYNGSMWVVGGQVSPNNLAYSYDGINWTGTTSPITAEVNNITWDGTKWLAVGTGTFNLAHSTNGISWTGITQSAFTLPETIVYNGTTYVVSTNGGTKSYYSYDGISWSGSTGISTGSFSRALACKTEPYHIPPTT